MSYGTSSFGGGSFGADSTIQYAIAGEVGALSDSSIFSSIGFVSALEAGSLAETQSMQGEFARSLSDALALSEHQSMLGTNPASQSEVLSLVDSSGYLVVQNAGVDEGVSMLDNTAAMTTYFLQASESVSIIDHIDVGGVFTAVLDDDAALADWIAAGQLFSKVQDELANLSENATGEVTVALVLILGTARVSDGPAPGSGTRLMNYYLLGSSVTLISSFADLNGLPVEPTEVDIEILQPDDTIAYVGNDQITNLGGGTYTFSFQPPMAGIYFYRFIGQGTNSVVAEAYFLVQQSFN